jgi:hypothetical protein
MLNPLPQARHVDRQIGKTAASNREGIRGRRNSTTALDDSDLIADRPRLNRRIEVLHLSLAGFAQALNREVHHVDTLRLIDNRDSLAHCSTG